MILGSFYVSHSTLPIYYEIIGKFCVRELKKPKQPYLIKRIITSFSTIEKAWAPNIVKKALKRRNWNSQTRSILAPSSTLLSNCPSTSDWGRKTSEGVVFKISFHSHILYSPRPTLKVINPPAQLQTTLWPQTKLQRETKVRVKWETELLTRFVLLLLKWNYMYITISQN